MTKRATLIPLLLFAALYTGDYIFLRYRRMNGRNIRDAVQVQRYYAIAEKNNKTEFMYDEPESRECVCALFPHFGDVPCWYARRHREERIDE
jgi:hypothetical protein